MQTNYLYMYPKEIVLPLKNELIEHGFEDLNSPELLLEFLNRKGTGLIVINSVCGCAAGTCRPGVIMGILNSEKKPTHLGTCFAGFDIEAVQVLREHLLPYPPSSPAIAFFKDGELIEFIERHLIEARPAQIIAESLIEIFNKNC